MVAFPLGSRVGRSKLGVEFAHSAGALARSHGDNGGGVVLLFTHAVGFCKEVWISTLNALGEQVERERRLGGGDEGGSDFGHSNDEGGSDGSHGTSIIDWVCLDHTGHGRSRDMPPGETWDAFSVDDVQSVVADVAAVNPTRAMIGVGHSMGGAALVLAEHATPGKFQHLTIIEPPLFPRSLSLLVPIAEVARGFGYEMNPLVAKTLRRRSTWPSREHAKESMQRAFPGFTEHAQDAWVAGSLVDDGGGSNGSDGAVKLRLSTSNEASFYSHTASFTPTSFAGKASLRFACGEKSTFGLPWSNGVPYYRGFSEEFQAPFKILDGATHFAPMEVPERLASMIKTDLTEVTGNRRWRLG